MPNGVIDTVAESAGGAGAGAGEGAGTGAGAGEGGDGLPGADDPHAAIANVSVTATMNATGKRVSEDVTVVCRNG
jgi:hypothetical protein